MEISNELKKIIENSQNIIDERQIYFSGFTITINPAEVRVQLEAFDKTYAQLATSHILAKTLSVKLSALISEFESGTGYTIPTLDELKSKNDEETPEST